MLNNSQSLAADYANSPHTMMIGGTLMMTLTLAITLSGESSKRHMTVLNVKQYSRNMGTMADTVAEVEIEDSIYAAWYNTYTPGEEVSSLRIQPGYVAWEKFSSALLSQLIYHGIIDSSLCLDGVSCKPLLTESSMSYLYLGHDTGGLLGPSIRYSVQLQDTMMRTDTATVSPAEKVGERQAENRYTRNVYSTKIITTTVANINSFENPYGGWDAQEAKWVAYSGAELAEKKAEEDWVNTRGDAQETVSSNRQYITIFAEKVKQQEKEVEDMWNIDGDLPSYDTVITSKDKG